jgi:hypothetical protein
VFSKAPGSWPDTSLLTQHQCMVTNPLLRRSRALFPCIDSPLYLYSPGALHYLPYTFDIHVTVPPSHTAVCSGVLVQQTCGVALRPSHPNSSSNRSANGAAAAAAAAAAEEQGTVVVSRTFEYSVTVPVVPAQLTLAVGPFAAIPYADLMSAGGLGPVALPEGMPVITVFAMRPQKSSNGTRGGSSTYGWAQQKEGSGGVPTAAAAGGAGGGASAGRQGGVAAAAAAAAAAAGGSAASTLAAFDARELQQLADTLRPLAALLGTYAKVLACSLPWSHVQVAVVPDGCMLQPWQV